MSLFGLGDAKITAHSYVNFTHIAGTIHMNCQCSACEVQKMYAQSWVVMAQFSLDSCPKSARKWGVNVQLFVLTRHNFRTIPWIVLGGGGGHWLCAYGADRNCAQMCEFQTGHNWHGKYNVYAHTFFAFRWCFRAKSSMSRDEAEQMWFTDD